MKLFSSQIAALVVLISVLVCPRTGWADALQQPKPGKKIKVFILAGQSNMEGRADGEKLTAQDRHRLKNVQGQIQLAFNDSPLSPLDAVRPPKEIAEIYKCDLIFGPELFFGMALSEAWPDEKILLIKRAEGATSLHGAWNPDWTTDKAAILSEEKDPKLYDDLTGYINQVLSGYKKGEYEICAMLWVQGETDSGNGVAASQYGENLERLVNSIRSDLGDEKLPFMLFQVGHGKVVEGMKRTAKKVSNVTLIPQSQNPVSLDFYQKMENGHYNYDGMKKLGNRFAEVFLNVTHN